MMPNTSCNSFFPSTKPNPPGLKKRDPGNPIVARGGGGGGDKCRLLVG